MARKGLVSEIFSKALYHDNPDLYFVGYLDFNIIKESTLTEFLKISENFETIPATRIFYIKKENKTLYHKSNNKKDPKSLECF
ncbi:MAG: DUF504 domain-containing protein [Thaumarchaeota archaeon]|nr:DUF504 domain-containing protein [Nitrososphaerota archaeon]